MTLSMQVYLVMIVILIILFASNVIIMIVSDEFKDNN